MSELCLTESSLAVLLQFGLEQTVGRFGRAFCWWTETSRGEFEELEKHFDELRSSQLVFLLMWSWSLMSDSRLWTFEEAIELYLLFLVVCFKLKLSIGVQVVWLLSFIVSFMFIRKTSFLSMVIPIKPSTVNSFLKCNPFLHKRIIVSVRRVLTLSWSAVTDILIGSFEKWSMSTFEYKQRV